MSIDSIYTSRNLKYWAGRWTLVFFNDYDILHFPIVFAYIS